jgi:hypothetical protein
MRNLFSMSHYRPMTFSMGELVPAMVFEVLPGDVIQHSIDALLRVSPLLTPVMHPVRVHTYTFYVPTRVVWEDFEDFITGGDDGNDASVYPQITLTPTEGSLGDYLGLPIGTEISVNANIFRAYADIWNNYFRDKDLQTELTIDRTSGADSTTNTTLQNKCWEKDFFTTCRPTQQKGDDVLLPLGTTAPVTINTGDSTEIGNAAGSANYGPLQIAEASHATFPGGLHGLAPPAGAGVDADVVLRGSADLTSATAATINELRQAFAEQRFKEARSRYGNDYRDYLAWLGVRSPDARLQRPEYMGGGRSTISFSEVIQGAPDFDANTGVGNLHGHGIAGLRSNFYKKFFYEHGYLISMICVLPKTMYVDGLPYMWTKTTKEEFWQKEYQHVGQRAVQNREVYAAHASPTETFGYQDNYDEYRQMPSGVAGEFRSTLDEWHMARSFGSDPALNAAFVSANPTNRIYQSTSTDQLYALVYHNMRAKRLLDSRGG